MLIFDILLFIGVVKAQIVVTTWGADGFQEATFNAFEAYRNGNSRMASLVEGLSTCERLQCDTTVGYGGSPDENGETTLDALLIDGPGHKMSGVAQLRRVKDAARVAWAVMNYTEHTMLVGEQATQFALRMGFSETDLTTNASLEMLQKWKNNNCQPNFWTNVFPNPKQTCGPYHRNEIFKTNSKSEIVTNRVIDRYNHDTIGMVIIDESGEISAGTSTNGASHKKFVHHIAIEREPPKTPLRTASSQSLHSTVLKQQHRQHTHVRDHQNDVFSTVKTARLPEEFSTTAIYQKGNLLDEKGLTKGRGVLVSSFRSHHSSASTNATKTSYEEEERYRCEHLLTRANGGPPLKESDFHGDTPVVHYHYVAGSLECFHSISRSNSKKRRNERHGDSGRKRTKDKGEMERWIESQHSQQVTTHRKPPPIPVFDEKPQISTIGTEKSTKSTEDGDLYEELDSMSWRDYPGTPQPNNSQSIQRTAITSVTPSFTSPSPFHLSTPPSIPQRSSSLFSGNGLTHFSSSRVSIQEREERRRFLHSPTSPLRAYDDIRQMSGGIDAQQRLSSYSLHSIADERDSIQKKTFTKWVNKHLQKSSRSVTDLFEDLRDGINLIILLEALTGDRFNRERGVTQFHRMQNVQCCLDYLKQKNIKLVNIRAEDIVDGNGKLTLGLIWTIILNFQVSQVQRLHQQKHANGNGDSLKAYELVHGNASFTATSAREALLNWAQEATDGYPQVRVSNFSSSWRDGLAFNAILHRYRPNLIKWSQVTAPGVSNLDRLENAFEMAEREFGVTRLIDPEDMDTTNIDEKSVITYLSTLHIALPPLPEQSKSNTGDLLSRLKRGCEIVNEKLDIILQTIEEIETKLERMPSVEVERRIATTLNELEALLQPIEILGKDVDELESLEHPDSPVFRKLVNALEQRRRAYIDRLRNRISNRLAIVNENIRKESHRLETIRTNSFQRVEEAIRWVREKSRKIHEIAFIDDLELLEKSFEAHKVDNRDTQDYRQQVDQCISRQSEVPDDDTKEYCSLLRTLESEYQQLRDFSAGRMLDLDSLIAFVRAAQIELLWISEREEIEVTRTWGEPEKLDLPVLQNHCKKLRHEMELRDKQFTDIHNRGAALLNQGHPAVGVIEYYLRRMRSQWEWLSALAQCLDVHTKDASDHMAVVEDLQLAEQWIEGQLAWLSRKFSATNYGAEDGEKDLTELENIKEVLAKHNETVRLLAEKVRTLSPLWQRNDSVTSPIPVTALVDFVEKNVSIKEGDQVFLTNSVDPIQWKIRDVSHREGFVPSVVFRLPPPDQRLNAQLVRFIQKFQKLSQLWTDKHRHVRFHLVANTMRWIQNWNVDDFMDFADEKRAKILGALDEDIGKLVGELEQRSQKTPEPDFSEQFDQQMTTILRKLDDSWRVLTDRIGRPVERSLAEHDQTLEEHKHFEESLHSLDSDVSTVKGLYSQISDPTAAQRLNLEKLKDLWENLWDLARMYVERLKVQEAVMNGTNQLTETAKKHEIALCSHDDLSSDLQKMAKIRENLVATKMTLGQEQWLLDSLNAQVAALRQHVIRTRQHIPTHPDVDHVEDEAQQLNVRWENICVQVNTSFRIENAWKRWRKTMQTMGFVRGELLNEMTWLEKVEKTIDQLRRPEELRSNELQQQLDILAQEYSQLQERTAAIEALNREGGKYIREAKQHDLRIDQYTDGVIRVHGSGIRDLFTRAIPQPMNGAQTVASELEILNKRFAQLSSMILEKQNRVQIMEEALKECLERQKDLDSAIAGLGNLEQTIYPTKLNLQLNQERPEDAANEVQSVKASLDEWASRVREQLEMADRLCAEQVDQLPPDQYAILKQKRDELANVYENTVRNVEMVYERLHAITQLLIEFSTHSSSMQSADNWLRQLENQLNDLFGKKGVPVEERLRIADEMNRRVADEQSQLDDADQAAMKLLGILEGTPAYDEVKERHQKEHNERRKRHSLVLDQLQRVVNEATTEQAIGEGVKDAVKGLGEWADQWEDKMSQQHPIPLKQDLLSTLKKEEQLEHSEADARRALADQLENEVRKLSTTNPSLVEKRVDAVAQAVEDKAQKAAELSELDKKFSKLKEEFGSWLNDLDETVSSLSPLSSTSDGLKEQQKSAHKELERLSIAIAELETIPGSRSSSIPRNVFDLRSRYDQLGSQIDGRAQKINEQQKQAHQFEDKAAAVQQWIKEQRESWRMSSRWISQLME
ncbi:unnamed protein product, partial [Mesorhabditis belari]|uniref:Dystrophin n=1 Tax=Mesorhabditis belari TaxID=2138241 RepID=A0AAF3J9I8_9BILA